MNRTDRLLAIVLELQGRGHCRAEDLAKTFETSQRTIYRDMQALGQVGVPVVSVPGRGYSLVEGYFLPPLTFTGDEAMMLLLGSDVMAQSFDAQYREAAHSAGRKIGGVLPVRVREEVRRLRERIVFVPPGAGMGDEQAARLQLLRRALLEHRAVRFRYYTRSRAEGAQEPLTRDVHPYALTHVRGTWYLTAHDTLRGDVRHFRLERMEDLTPLAETFASPEHFRPMRRHIPPEETLTIRVLFAARVARWVREQPSYFTASQEDTPDGLLVTLRPREEGEVLQWLLGWGSAARVLEPESLRRRLAAEIAAMARQYETAGG